MDKYKNCIVIIFMITFLGCNSNNAKSNEPYTIDNTSQKSEMVAPNYHNYVEFMDIPIEGDVDAFGNKLSAKGYKFFCEETAMPALVYEGNYLNREARIMLDFEKESRKIKSARVIFNGEIPNVASLIKEYTDKYGKCKMKVVGSFVNYTWKVNGGKITVMTCDSPTLSIEYYNYWKK